ncbi:MAG: pyridoxamine 5'-phosphate oxidase [Litorilinea sp.]
MSNAMQEIRKEYHRARLLETIVPDDPQELFSQWLAQAIAAGIHEPNAMTVATADAQGRPSARTILLKDFDARGFCFYTNYTSRKARELAENPWATLLFWWGPLERQVRIEGQVARVAETESDAYFASRPLGARLGAWVSPQSQEIPDRAFLEARLAEVEAEFAGEQPPRPPDWGGYRLMPTALEFWQGGPHRLHDRLIYVRRADGGWDIRRLAP